MAGGKSIGGAIGLVLALAAPPSPGAPAARPEPAINERMSGDIAPVHDPAIIRQGDLYYLFTTSQEKERSGLIHVHTSGDLVHWRRAGAVFAEMPAWTKRAVPGTSGIWAPDISLSKGMFRLYYSVSTFGRNRSAIGLATSPTLDPQAPGWTDQGPVIESGASDDFNAIDPNAFTDRDGRQWLVFGSFWSGIKLIALDPATGRRSRTDRSVRALARRPGPGAVEAPFLIERGGFHYLFVSYDFCCRGSESSYYTVVGRSRAVTGPYVDRAGKAMLSGGGLIVLHADLDPAKRFAGPGHVAILREGGRDTIIYHAYDKKAGGAPTLRIRPLAWTEDGWPVAL